MPWIGPVAGAVVGGLMNSGSGGSSSVTNGVPPEFSPLASFIAQRGQQLGNLPFTPLPFNPVAGFTQPQFAGFDMTMNRAMQPSATLQNAENNIAQTAGGGYLQNNPYIDQMVNRTMDDTQNRMTTGLLNSGSFGNANATEAAARGIADSGNAVRFGNYSQERDRMMGASGMAPGAYQAGFMPAQQMLGIGATMQQQGQNQLNAAQTEFGRAQQWPFQTFQTALGPFGTNIGGQQTTQGPRGNVASGLLGGAMMGGQMQNWWNSGGSPQFTNQAGRQPGYDDYRWGG